MRNNVGFSSSAAGAKAWLPGSAAERARRVPAGGDAPSPSTRKAGER